MPSDALERVWNIVKKLPKNSPLKVSGNYFKYLDDVKLPKFGDHFATMNTFNRNFKKRFPEVESVIVEVHHAVPQEISDRWNLVNQTNMHSFENLRGMPSKEFHNAITQEWNDLLRPYRTANVAPPMNLIMEKAKEIDDRLGTHFIPPIR